MAHFKTLLKILFWGFSTIQCDVYFFLQVMKQCVNCMGFFLSKSNMSNTTVHNTLILLYNI